MRRTVATLLVIASPVLMAVPVRAGESRAAVPTVLPATPAPAVAAGPVALVPPAVPAPAVAPAVPAPTAATAPAVTAVRPVTKVTKAPAAAVDDAAYAARLQADLCQARAIFCGLDQGGRYPAG